MSVGGYICIYLAVYCPEIIGGFAIEEKRKKTEVVCGLGRRNYGRFLNVHPPIIDPQPIKGKEVPNEALGLD